MNSTTNITKSLPSAAELTQLLQSGVLTKKRFTETPFHIRSRPTGYSDDNFSPTAPKLLDDTDQQSGSTMQYRVAISGGTKATEQEGCYDDVQISLLLHTIREVITTGEAYTGRCRVSLRTNNDQSDRAGRSDLELDFPATKDSAAMRFVFEGVLRPIEWDNELDISKRFSVNMGRGDLRDFELKDPDQ